MSGSDVCGEGHPTYPVMHMMYLPRMDRQMAVKTLLPATSLVSSNRHFIRHYSIMWTVSILYSKNM